MVLAQNGWTGIPRAAFPPLHNWNIPCSDGSIRTVPLRQGSAGFLLCHFAMWWDATISPIPGGVFDEWGYSYRYIGNSGVLSNHAPGTALDIDATQFPQGTYHLTAKQRSLIKRRMTFFSGTLAHGAFYRTTVDEMHSEIAALLPAVEKKARALADSERGYRLLKANPGQRAVIFS